MLLGAGLGCVNSVIASLALDIVFVILLSLTHGRLLGGDELGFKVDIFIDLAFGFIFCTLLGLTLGTLPGNKLCKIVVCIIEGLTQGQILICIELGCTDGEERVLGFMQKS